MVLEEAPPLLGEDELFYLDVGSRGNLRIVEDEENCHPSDRKWRRGQGGGMARGARELVDENRAIYSTAMSPGGIMDNVWKRHIRASEALYSSARRRIIRRI